MNLERALRDLRQALDDGPEPNAGNRISAARRIITDAGAEALGIEPSPGLTLHGLIQAAVTMPLTPARRDFAVLLIHALATDGLVATKSNRNQFDRALCAFIESALPSVLLRFGYPFGTEAYERRRSLERLHAVLDDMLQPLEPTFPPRIQGLYAG